MFHISPKLVWMFYISWLECFMCHSMLLVIKVRFLYGCNQILSCFCFFCAVSECFSRLWFYMFLKGLAWMFQVFHVKCYTHRFFVSVCSEIGCCMFYSIAPELFIFVLGYMPAYSRLILRTFHIFTQINIVNVHYFELKSKQHWLNC